MQVTNSAVDFPTVMERIGGDEELLRELVGLYLEDEGTLLGAIDDSLSAGDGERLFRAAHTLKGAVSNFCAPAARQAAQDLEMAGREGRLADAMVLADGLRAQLALVRDALAPYRP